MPESVCDVNELPGSSGECGTPPLRQFSQSLPPRRRNSCAIRPFCTQDNVPECLLHISQEVSSLGLPPDWAESGSGGSELNIVAVLNCMYDLIQLHHRALQTLEDMEVGQLKSNSNMEYLQVTSTRLKEQLELSKRETTGLLERERQLQQRVKTLQNSLKNEKEEVQKLQNIIASRASHYNHDMKRKEREFNRLKERLNQLLVDKKEKKQAIDVLNYIGRADGRRSLWKTVKTEAKHEGEMYKTLLCDYDSRQQELLLENAELRKLLQQMKGDIMSILRTGKPAAKGEKHGDRTTQAKAEGEEDVFDAAKESVELSCLGAREELTNSIRLQWRRLKSHVERLDSQASLAQRHEGTKSDAVPREVHEEEMDRLKLEIQQCKDFIHTQQQLLQQRLNSSCNEETAFLLNECCVVEENKHLREEWKTLEEQRKIFERERRNFTEAAIRLSQERKAFEEDRATWLKHQFLSMTQFPESKMTRISKSKSAFSISDSESGSTSAHGSQPEIAAPTNRGPALRSPRAQDLHSTICLFSENGPKPNTANLLLQESSGL